MAQPWPFFFLATFLAAFFFFFAMEMAPYREHPDTHLTPLPLDARGRERDDVSSVVARARARASADDWRVVKDEGKNCQEKFWIFFRNSSVARLTFPAPCISSASMTTRYDCRRAQSSSSAT
jgi:hypothetical protein